jgi:hypothetical protein
MLLLAASATQRDMQLILSQGTSLLAVHRHVPEARRRRDVTDRGGHDVADMTLLLQRHRGVGTLETRRRRDVQRHRIAETLETRRRRDVQRHRIAETLETREFVR